MMMMMMIVIFCQESAIWRWYWCSIHFGPILVLYLKRLVIQVSTMRSEQKFDHCPQIKWNMALLKPHSNHSNSDSKNQCTLLNINIHFLNVTSNTRSCSLIHFHISQVQSFWLPVWYIRWEVVVKCTRITHHAVFLFSWKIKCILKLWIALVYPFLILEVTEFITMIAVLTLTPDNYLKAARYSSNLHSNTICSTVFSNLASYSNWEIPA